MHWKQYIIVKVIYQNFLMNLNYKDFPCHGAVICNCCRNYLTVQSHGTFRWIIPKNISQTIEITCDQRMLTDDARLCVTGKACLLFSVIYQYCINSNGPDNGGNRSFTNNYMPCQCRVFTIGCGGSCFWCLW